MKTSRFKQKYRNSSSRLHRKVGDILRNSIFSFYRLYQEYPVQRINSSYPNASHRFDWVILDLAIVIECHGQQHYTPVTFGGISTEQALDRKFDQTCRDRDKADAAVAAGFTYIEIPYTDTDKISEEYIWNLYKTNINNQPLLKIEKKKNQYKQEQLALAKKQRQEDYRRKKEWIKSKKQE